ncbi:MAG: choice-of-anchor R domain-containing protein [Candidatus Sungbacteria bacterium]|nr:choice-of-anchor R domain-containing protein [Candidatus Sungbacteria bacterium]
MGWSLSSLTRHTAGYAALTMMFIVMGVTLAVIASFTFFTIQEVAIDRNYHRAVEARFIAEGGIEDATYRILTGKQIGGTETLTVGTGEATVSVVTAGSARTVRSEGKRDTVQKNLETKIDITTDGVSFFYGVQVGAGGLKMENNSKIIGNVYSNGSIVGDAGATITGDAVVAGGITTNPQVEWTTHNADQFFATTTASRDIAQSFTASAADPLAKVSVYLAKVGSPTANITLRITTDNGGKPSNSGSLASATIIPSSVGTTASWIDVTFASPPALTSGVKYWIVLDYGANSASNHWNWRKDATDGYTGNTGRYANDWSSGSAVWINVGGDLAFRAWIGGVINQIQDVTVGDATTGTARANLFVNTTVHGSSCPNAFCIVDNPPQEPLPISAGVIQDWRDDATAGGVINGDYTVTSDVNLGPKKITGNLIMTSNNNTVTVSGTIYVEGNIDISNGSTIHCLSSYGANSCVIVADGWIHLSNNGVFQGSGSAGSFIMLLSDLACDGSSATAPNGKTCGHHNSAVDLHNNADGAIFYASNGLVNFHNNVAASEVTAYKISLDNNATVTYESGLANLSFSSGPSGGYDIQYWKEVE